MICMEILDTGAYKQIARPLWVIRNRNGLVITPHRHKAQGISDGKTVWSLGNLEGCPRARVITLAEFLEKQRKGGTIG